MGKIADVDAFKKEFDSLTARGALVLAQVGVAVTEDDDRGVLKGLRDLASVCVEGAEMLNRHADELEDEMNSSPPDTP